MSSCIVTMPSPYSQKVRSFLCYKDLVARTSCRGFHHGRSSTCSPLDASWALVDRIAELGAGAASGPITPNDPRPGSRVSVTPNDYGKDPVAGDLVSSGPDHVVLRHETPETGAIHVHSTHWGYRIVPA